MAAPGTSQSTARDLLRPEVLSHLKNLDLVARSVVEGFLIGLHRSPKFGFSQEFASSTGTSMPVPKKWLSSVFWAKRIRT